MLEINYPFAVSKRNDRTPVGEAPGRFIKEVREEVEGKLTKEVGPASRQPSTYGSDYRQHESAIVNGTWVASTLRVAVSHRDRHPQTKPAYILCLGEVIADLVCETETEPGRRPSNFVPHPGGALANVAVAASRAGACAALAGGVGDDETGDWLLEGLREEGVHTDWIARVESADTPVALVMFDDRLEPRFQVFGEYIGSMMLAVAPRLPEAVNSSQALVVGSNTMVGEAERLVTREAIKIAQSQGIPVLFDPNFRPNRWRETKTAASYCRELTADSEVIKCNRYEAELITGLADPKDAVAKLAAMGPRLAVVTCGGDAVFSAGACEAKVRPKDTEVLSPLGAGDTFMGTFTAGLSSLDWDYSGAAEVLSAAVGAATKSCRRWGAQ